MSDRTCSYCGGLMPTAHHRVTCGKVDCRKAHNTAAKARARAAAGEAGRVAERATLQRWRDRNPGKIKQNNRASYTANPARYAKQRDQWRLDNPVRHRQLAVEAQARRRAAKLGGGVFEVTASDWAKAVRRAGGCCVYCGACTKLTQDHVVPLSRGGRHSIGNLAPACEKCNKSKGALFITEWKMRDAIHSAVPR